MQGEYPSAPIAWMLEGDPWVRVQVQRDLIQNGQSTDRYQTDRESFLADPRFVNMITSLQNWPCMPLSSHKSAGHPIHILEFLAETGFNRSDAGISEIADKIFETQSTDGPFQVLMNIPLHFGGTGIDELAWALCDSPLVTWSLARMGWAEDTRVHTAVEKFLSMSKENGWPCGGNLGKFRGPGRKEDPCPYATLLMLKCCSELPAYKNSQAVQQGIDSLLHLWSSSIDSHPYMFYMGNDFRKLKAPLVWYDLLHVLTILRKYDQARKDPRYSEMTDLLRSKMDAEGKFTPSSIWQIWKDWEFGQKKTPSRYLTFLCWRILLAEA